MDQSKMSNSSVRHKIFENWPKPSSKQVDRSHDSFRKQRKSNESLRAEEALQRSLLFLNNIEKFKMEIQHYEQKHEQLKKNLSGIVDQLQDINTNDSRSFDSDILNHTLKEYFRQIRRAGRLSENLKYFSLANLANYDTKHTAMKFTRTDEEANRDLNKKLNDLKEKRRKVQETLFGYQFNIPESQILGEENTFERSLENLLTALNSENKIEFHYLMMYKLRELHKLQERHENLLTYSHENYSRFEGLNDSMNLMKNQSIQMRNDRKEMSLKFDDLTFDNADDIIPQTISGLPLLEKNKEIYQSNMNLLSRYSAQTSLLDYEKRRKQYVEQLRKYNQEYQNWKQEQKYASYLYQRHKIFSQYKKRKDLANKQQELKQKQSIKKAYLECLQYQVPKHLTKIIAYKYKLVNEMEKEMKESGIIMQKRFSKHENDKLRKYLDFFVQIEYKSSVEKLAYLRSNKQTIDALNYQFSQEFDILNQDIESQKYQVGLSLAEILADEKKVQQLDQTLESLKNLLKRRWQALPIGLESVVFYYINDLRIKKYYENFLDKYRQKMQNYKEKMISEMEQVEKWGNHVQISQVPYSCLKSDGQERRQPYKNYIRKISDHCPQIKEQMEEEYWSIAQIAIKEAYDTIIPKIQSLQGVDKKNFFTFKILCYLTQDHKILKIANIDQILEHRIDTIDRYFNNRWDQHHFFIEIIKLRIFHKYLKNVLSKFTNVNIYCTIVKHLLWACLRLYEVRDHIDLIGKEELDEHIEHSLKIYHDYLNYKVSFKTTQNPYLQDKCFKLTEEMKRLPLVLGSKQEIKNYENFFSLKSRLQILDGLSHHQPQHFYLSQTYVSCLKLYQMYLDSRLDFQPSDIISVKDKNQYNVYLQKQAQRVQEKLEPFQQQLYIIGKLFRGQQYPKHRQKSHSEQIEDIIQYLESISLKQLWVE